jgi:integrase
MSQEIIIDSQPLSAEMRSETPLAVAIGAWLDNKKQHSGSERTERAYHDTLASFQQFLQANGLDLDSQDDLTGYLQVWAGQQGYKRDRNGQIIKPVNISRATFNHRLAVVSSFYRFALRRKYLSTANPAEGIERGKVQDYAHAQALGPEQVKAALQAINREIPVGLRDYALLQVALNTGRRRAELAALRWGDLRWEGNRVLITWPQAKGGKSMHDLLDPRISATLTRYLHAVYGTELGTLPHDAPIWVAFDRAHAGHALTTQAIANIVETHLGTSKAHTTRHTFAHSMEAVGAKVSDIQARLGHSSLQTTGTYLAALKSAYNPQAEALADLFGAEED